MVSTVSTASPAAWTHGGDLLLPVAAAFEGGLPVVGADADGHADVGDLRFDVQHGLAADDDLGSGSGGVLMGTSGGVRAR